jgi:hypothetical protein
MTHSVCEGAPTIVFHKQMLHGSVTIDAAALTLARFLSPILPKKFHVNPADVIAATLLDAVIVAKAGCRWIKADEMNEAR